MKKLFFTFLTAAILTGCAYDRDAEKKITDNAHNFIEQIFHAQW